jgi:hypothetical protein
MDGESLTFLVSGDEALADAMASACREVLGGAVPFVSPSGAGAWRVIVRIPPAARGETGWMDVAKALSAAMSSFDMTIEHPQEEALRQRLDRLFAECGRLLAAQPGAKVMAGITGQKPVPLGKAKGSSFAWKLIR